MNKSIFTQCVHGLESEPEKGGVLTPIYTSTAYNYLEADPLNYPRYYNTINQQEVANKIKLLEWGEHGLVFSSGLAAITTTLMTLLKEGDHAIFQGDIYGGTHYANTSALSKFGIAFSFTENMEVGSLEKLIQPNTKLVYVETPSNPLLKIVDLAGIARLSKAHGFYSVIDNTFASPINQRPLEHGIDVVTHSGTKYLGGHSDLTCGAVVTSADIGNKIYKTAVNLGGSLDPQSCYLLDRSLKTLAIRVRQQNDNALQIAHTLSESEKIEAVYYPGLATHPGHKIAKQQMNGFGAMLSFEVMGDADSFVKILALIKPAISLGGVESTISSPEQTSHAKLSPEQRQEAGIKPNLLRLSVGNEDVYDLPQDLQQAKEQL